MSFAQVPLKNMQLSITVSNSWSSRSPCSVKRPSLSIQYNFPHFLILDEATNALDTNSEDLIIQNIIKNYEPLNTNNNTIE